MEEEEQNNGVIIQEMLVQGEKLVNQVTGETMTINLEDASQIVLQEPDGGATGLQGAVHEAVQIQPGTYQILTGEEIQLGEEMAGQEVDGVTQIEVPLEMLQEAVEMLQGQDIQGDAVEAAIASIAARHMEIAQVGATDAEGDMDIMEVTQSDIDAANAHAAYNPELLNSTEPDKALPDTSELEALTASDRDNIITVADPETSKPSVVLVSQSATATSSKPRDMVSLLYGTTHSAVPIPNTVQNSLSSEAVPLQTVSNAQIPQTGAEVSKTAATTTSETADVDTASLQQPISNSVAELRGDSEESYLTVNNSSKNLADSSAVHGDATSINSKGTRLVQENPPPMEPPPPPPPDKKPDYSEPIEIKENMEIFVGSRKCIVLPNPDTGKLCAYPLIPIGGKRKRGRPRKEIKVEPVQEEMAENGEDKENVSGTDPAPVPGKPVESQADAAESLLELSNTGPDGVRRSGRKRRKARTLKDYSILKGSSDEESQDDSEEEFHISDLDLSSSDEMIEDSGDEEYKPNGPRKKRKPDYNSNPALLLGQKRGPGRPRRYPHPGQPAHPAQIPAILVNGQTIMIQGLENVTSAGRPLAPLMPKPPQGTTPTSSPQVIMINNSTTTTEGKDAQGSVAEANQAATTLEIPTSVAQTADGQATILQFSDDVVNMLMKKDPIKLGLKAPDMDLEKLKCPLCDFQAYYPQQYQEHIFSHPDEVHKCKCCQYGTLDEPELIEHYKASHPRSICPVCNFTAEQPYVVKRHMSRHDEKGCTCQICGKVYKDQYILKMHLKQVHMPADVLYECTVCGKKFTRKAHLKRHLRTHEVEKPFKCPHCEYRGCEKSDVAKHLLIHEEPKYVCEICGKAFRHIKNKEIHVKRHSGQKDYKCGICDKYGYTFTDIRKHIERTHSDVKTSMFICEKCGSSFRDNQAFREHHEQGCDQMTIEQALSITTGETETGQSTIQIPASVLQAEGQPITYDGQHLTIGGNQVNITVQHMNLDPEEDSIMLTEEQLAEAQIAVADGQIAVTDGGTQVISTAHMVTDLVEAGLAHVTPAAEVGLAQVNQTVEAGEETLDQAVVISAEEAENSIVLA
ncbi:uncharacterized protein LOC135476165 [Liolophura sinensis]|uniref:uncharacterized protein LOC135476165 n=1 Tax=Liolophura sinensis TaxID=3198878 RepID=UPI0031597B8A